MLAKTALAIARHSAFRLIVLRQAIFYQGISAKGFLPLSKRKKRQRHSGFFYTVFSSISFLVTPRYYS